MLYRRCPHRRCDQFLLSCLIASLCTLQMVVGQRLEQKKTQRSQRKQTDLRGRIKSPRLFLVSPQHFAFHDKTGINTSVFF